MATAGAASGDGGGGKASGKPRGRARGKKGDATLLSVLGPFLAKRLLPDLKARAEDPEVKAELAREHASKAASKRTGETLAEHTAALLEQIGAAWVLSVVFVRTLESRGMVAERLAGSGAASAEDTFFQLFPRLGMRDWMLAVFREVAVSPGAKALLGPEKNPAFRLAPSEAVARELLGLFRSEDAARTPAAWPELAQPGTRFLGDLYQDLSERVRERYALLQTPDFVERFILDLTLEPAVAEWGAGAVTVLDPACGSGHFLLGAFERLVEHRRRREPGLPVAVVAARVLEEQIHGVDINPYAVAIARFRLTLAWMAAVGETQIAHVPALGLKVVVGDALVHGAGNRDLAQVAADDAAWKRGMYELAEEEATEALFRQRFHVVVGNPPYITCKDAVLREVYRASYNAAAGKYSLAAPFAELIFSAARPGGYTGQITANSFMKREFGKKLVEQVLPHLDLTHVIDTSGAYIPGHGTPTVILVGRHRAPLTPTLTAVLGKRGEPETPEIPERGKVWTSIATKVTSAPFEDDFISVVESQRAGFAKHPWSIGGGGATELKEFLEAASSTTLGNLAASIGYTTICGEDECFILDDTVRRQMLRQFSVPLVFGEIIRDWSLAETPTVVFPYDDLSGPAWAELKGRAQTYLWPYRTLLRNRRIFQKTLEEKGERWFGHMYRDKDKLRTPLSIAFAEVATHNHFVLDRGGKVFKQTAPIIKLPATATEDDHLALLGYLNSSTACFWMKQVVFSKGNRGEGGGTTSEAWERFYQFSSTQLHATPLIWGKYRDRVIDIARQLDVAANARRACSAETAYRDILDMSPGSSIVAPVDLAKRQVELESRIRFLQEELDWTIYAAAGLASQSLLRPISPTDRRGPGQRPSDVLFAQQVLEGDIGRRYFELCRLPEPLVVAQTPLDECESRRLEAIKNSPDLRLIETPTYKRTYRESFRREPYVEVALDWVGRQFERSLAISTLSTSLTSLRYQVSQESAFLNVAAFISHYWQSADELHPVTEWVLSNGVPFLAAHRFTDAGLEKHAEWQATWALQRREDAGEDVGPIAVPPKYGQEDYREAATWRLRGKLDVPKERFILYPGLGRDDDPSPLIGWAGWNHLERARALAALYQARKHEDGWEAARLLPMLAGLDELTPWLRQWHDEPDPDFDGARMGEWFAGFVDAEARALGLTLSDLRSWRPAPKKGRPRKAAAAAPTPTPEDDA